MNILCDGWKHVITQKKTIEVNIYGFLINKNSRLIEIHSEIHTQYVVFDTDFKYEIRSLKKHLVLLLHPFQIKY